jgi:hypothetical protein
MFIFRSYNYEAVSEPVFICGFLFFEEIIRMIKISRSQRTNKFFRNIRTVIDEKIEKEDAKSARGGDDAYENN